MTPHKGHESGESVSGSKLKVEELVTVQTQNVLPLSSGLHRPEVDTSAIDPNKLKRKIDFRLLPWLTLLYLMSFLDRGSIGNARVCTFCIPILLAFPHRIFYLP